MQKDQHNQAMNKPNGAHNQHLRRQRDDSNGHGRSSKHKSTRFGRLGSKDFTSIELKKVGKHLLGSHIFWKILGYGKEAGVFWGGWQWWGGKQSLTESRAVWFKVTNSVTGWRAMLPVLREALEVQQGTQTNLINSLRQASLQRRKTMECSSRKGNKGRRTRKTGLILLRDRIQRKGEDTSESCFEFGLNCLYIPN